MGHARDGRSGSGAATDHGFRRRYGAGWAIVEMGGSAAKEDNFWELFVRPTGTSPWRLATPAGVADNGGLEAAGTGGSLVVGIRPSQDLTFSPLATTSHDGATWSAPGPVTPGLADAPDALASDSGGQLIALTGGQTAELGTRTGTAWTRLASVQAISATPAGRDCGLTGLTAATFVHSDVPMLAGRCSRPGTAGIFADHGGSWREAGPAVPRPLAGEEIDVLRLPAHRDRQRCRGPASGRVRRVGEPDRRLGGRGRMGAVGAAADRGAGNPLHGVRAGASGGRPAGRRRGRDAIRTGILLAGAAPAARFGAAALALGPGGRVDALAAHAGTFTDWRLTAGAGWRLTQTIQVTIPYGSSS